MKVAIVHDWLVTYAGAERVLEQIHQVFPDADLYAMVDHLGENRGFINNKPVNTSYIQKLPFSHRLYRNYLPLMPLAVEQFDMSGYDLVISSSHAVAKGVITGPDQLHISYVHSPIRYAWDLQHQYLAETGLDKGLKSMLVRRMLHRMRLWDLRTANGVDRFITNSSYISRRVWKVYRRESTVIYPPVSVSSFDCHNAKDDFYLAASRLVPYKKVSIIVRAFAGLPDRKLVVIGDGPEMGRIKREASANVEILGYQEDAVLRDYMQRARAFVYAAEEDFGIIPVEAMACGTPVIAYGKGGVTETVVGLDSGEPPTGVFFASQQADAIAKAIRDFERNESGFDATALRSRAEQFSDDKFRENFRQFVDDVLKSWAVDYSSSARP
jgi:glycosyltransferase involved in cell wall biosynthesis